MLDSVATDTRQFMSEAKFYEAYSRKKEDDTYETWEDAVDRVINMHRQYYKDYDIENYLDIASRAYKEKRILGAQRALQFGGEQLLKHEMKMYNCFAKETRFLTNQGMKSFADFSDGDTIIVKTHLGNWKSATIKNFGKQKLNKISIGKTPQSLREVYATPNHRWLLETGETTNLVQGDILYYFEDQSFNEFDWESASPNERLYWCYGYVYGDGTTNREYSHVRLCGKDVRFVNRFAEFGWKTTSPNSIQGDVYVFTGKYQKTLPDPKVDSIELIRAFTAGYLAADGTKGGDYWNSDLDKFEKHFTSIYAKKLEAQQFIADIFPLVGVWPISSKITNRKTNFGIHDGTSFGISTELKYNKFGQKYKVYDIVDSGREEDVWCLEVEDDHSFILEGGIATGNCTSSYADRPEFFGEAFYILLCGAGVGFSVQTHHVAKLPNISIRTKQPKIHVVEDSIEGWATALDVLLSSYFTGGGKYPEFEGRKVSFDLTKIRPKGAPISGGFKAPGPEGLRLALDKIELLIQNLLLNDKLTRLRPIDTYDIIMYAADAVLSGGVRRSATICLFSPDDDLMLNAKTGDWFIKNPQRGRSNNSALIIRSKATKEMFSNIMAKIKDFGEPGFVFAESEEHAFNPCVEIGMLPNYNGVSGWQGCNLVEINGAMCKTVEDFITACIAAAILGTLQAGYTNFKFVTDTTKKIFDREALLGVSITGWMNSPDILFDGKILTDGARVVRETNREIANIIGINPAARTTCVKPSGTASIILNTAYGIHPEHSPLYIRHVQLNKESDIVKIIKETNPEMIEESVWSANKTDYAVSFPIISPAGSIFKSSITDIEFLEKIKLVQSTWIEEGTNIDLCVDPTVRHNVSNTVSVQDWSAVEDYIFENRKHFAGISFTAATGDKAWNQAPNAEVLNAEQIVKKYGSAGILASGLVVDGLEAFPNLWQATSTALGFGEDLSYDSKENSLKRDWVRRFKAFGEKYFNNDLITTDHCLKDVYLLHKWEKIQRSFKPIDWSMLTQKADIDINTLGAIACVGPTGCEIVF